MEGFPSLGGEEQKVTKKWVVKKPKTQAKPGDGQQQQEELKQQQP